MDKITAFEVLVEHGIHVARSKYVDSLEDAIAFAERREARDKRYTPITLHVQAAGSTRMEVKESLESVGALRSSYRRVAAEADATGGRVLAQVAVLIGTVIVISGQTTEKTGKLMMVGAAEGGSISKPVPLRGDGMEALLTSFRAHHHQVPGKKNQRMLEHLLMRISRLFEQPEIASFWMVVCIHENEYTVIDASISTSRPLRLHRRLNARAHDRKGDDFHPSGRQ